MFSKFIDKIYSSVSSIPFDTLVWIIIGSFAAITLFTVIMCFVVPKIRAAEKRPYLCLVNAYTAGVVSALLTREPLAEAVLAAAKFW